MRCGFRAFDAMCVGCQGAPGVDPAPLAQGLGPPPPELEHAAEERSRAELFWITKHGVRMTGMPGFGPTHDDEAIWDVVAFLQELPQLTPEQYAALRERAAERERRDGAAAGSDAEPGGLHGGPAHGGHDHAP